jgi:hypothetical protein
MQGRLTPEHINMLDPKMLECQQDVVKIIHLNVFVCGQVPVKAEWT